MLSLLWLFTLIVLILVWRGIYMLQLFHHFLMLVYVNTLIIILLEVSVLAPWILMHWQNWLISLLAKVILFWSSLTMVNIWRSLWWCKGSWRSFNSYQSTCMYSCNIYYNQNNTERKDFWFHVDGALEAVYIPFIEIGHCWMSTVSWIYM